MKAVGKVTFSVLTVSDTRSAETDCSGCYLKDSIAEAGHLVAGYQIVKDSPPDIRSVLKAWCETTKPNVILITGGTGFKKRDLTPEAVVPLFSRQMPGFGELFRWLSWQEIGAATIQSRAVAGQIGSTLVFCLPGSPSACRLAWQEILLPQFDSTTKPCNFTDVLLD